MNEEVRFTARAPCDWRGEQNYLASRSDLVVLDDLSISKEGVSWEGKLEAAPCPGESGSFTSRLVMYLNIYAS